VWRAGHVLRAVRVASDIELHVTMHDDCDGRLMPPYLKITYTDVQRGSAPVKVISFHRRHDLRSIAVCQLNLQA